MSGNYAHLYCVLDYSDLVKVMDRYFVVRLA